MAVCHASVAVSSLECHQFGVSFDDFERLFGRSQRVQANPLPHCLSMQNY